MSQRKEKAKRREARNFKQALATQLGYIDRSCQLFDQGYEDEAIRIATQLRVVFNPGGGRKKSLLQHLNVHQKIRLLSTCDDVSPQVEKYWGMGSVRSYSNGESSGTEYSPSLSNSLVNRSMKFRDWWEQIVYIVSPGVILRRRDVICSAANEDGGAHFDAGLSLEYEELSTPGSAGDFVIEVDGKEEITPITGTHFICLRQIGYEVLHSPEIRRLANLS